MAGPAPPPMVGGSPPPRLPSALCGRYSYSTRAPPLTASSSSIVSSLEVSLVLLMIFSIQASNNRWCAAPLPQRRRRSCEPVHRPHLNRHFCDGHHRQRSLGLWRELSRGVVWR